MYTIKRAAELVGVSASTLRAWERRYGVDLTRRTPSGYRLYDDEAIDVLRTMHDLVGQGWSTHAAAQEINRRAPAGSSPATTEPPDDRTLAQIAAALDADGLSELLDHQFGTASFEAVVDHWLLPALQELGSAWENGHVTVAGEHMVAHGVTRRLAAAYDAAGDHRSPTRVIFGLAPGSRHDLGLLAVATAARRAGLSTTYLGVDVPVDDWVTAVRPGSVTAAVLAAASADDVPALTEVAAAIMAHSPGLLVAVGGSAQDLAPDACVRLGHQVGPAAALLARETERRARRSSPSPTQ